MEVTALLEILVKEVREELKETRKEMSILSRDVMDKFQSIYNMSASFIKREDMENKYYTKSEVDKMKETVVASVDECKLELSLLRKDADNNKISSFDKLWNFVLGFILMIISGLLGYWLKGR